MRDETCKLVCYFRMVYIDSFLRTYSPMVLTRLWFCPRSLIYSCSWLKLVDPQFLKIRFYSGNAENWSKLITVIQAFLS